MKPTEFAEKLNEWARVTMIDCHGTRFVAAGEGRAVARVDLKGRA